MTRQEQKLQQALDGFLEAFRKLDWKPFIASFAAEATVFFPFSEAPRRANGIVEIEANFAPLFASLRKRQPAGPPYIELDPVDLHTTITGTLALVSFHLHDSVEEQAVLCRRTFVWVDDAVQWRILHLHASNLPANAGVQSM